MSKLNTFEKDKILTKAFVYSCAGVAFFLPFGIKQTTYAIVLLVIVWLLQNNFKYLLNGLKKSKMLWLFCLPYLLMILSLTYTQDFKSGVWELEKGVSLLLFPLIFFSAKKMPVKSIHFILWSFILSNVCFGCVCLSYAIFKYYSEGVNLFFNFDLVNLFSSHPTYYSMYILFSLVSLYYLNKEKLNTGGWSTMKLIIIAIVLLFFILIFLLSVRYIFIVFTLAVITIIFIYTLKTKNIKIGLSFFSIFVIMVFLGLKNNSILRERLLQIKENYTYELSESTMEGYNGFTTRLAQWESSLSIIKTAPILGVGPGDVQQELQEVYKKNFLKYSYRDKLNAHNQYFQTCLGLGLVGLSVLLAGLFFPGMLAWKNGDILWISFLTIFSLCCITESMLYVQKGIVFYSFFNSLFAFHLLDRDSVESSIAKV